VPDDRAGAVRGQFNRFQSDMRHFHVASGSEIFPTFVETRFDILYFSEP
jgi:hypothetical protein